MSKLKELTKEELKLSKRCFNCLNGKPLTDFYFKRIVDNILRPHQIPWLKQTPEEKKEKTFAMVEILLENQIITEKLHTSFYDGVNGDETCRFIYTDDKWDWINKLNTNYTANGMMFTNILYKYLTRDAFEQLVIEMESGSLNRMKQYINDLTSTPTKCEKLYKRFFDNPSPTIIEAMQKTTKLGDQAENIIIDFLIEQGWETLYRGENGDLIDTKFGIDAVVSHADHGIRAIQIKHVKDIKFREEKNSYWITGAVLGIKPSVSLLGVATDNGSLIITEKQPKVTVVNEVVEYSNDMEWPNGKYGCFIDKPFLELIRIN